MSDMNALDRLNNLKNSSNDREFTLEEQLESIVKDENLDGMSMSAMANMRAITEVTLDDEEDEEPSFQSTKDILEEDTEETDDAPEVPYKPEPRIMKEEPNMREETSKEELFNNNTNVGRKRRQSKNNNSMSEIESNPIFDQLIHDLIESLRKNKYRLGRFDDKSMNMLFDYMENKF